MEPVYVDVYVDSPHPHLDRAFTYSVPQELAQLAVVGARVRVKFAGRKVDGFIRSFVKSAERPEKVLPILEVLGPAVVTPEIFDLSGAVAARYVGTNFSVLDSAVPNRLVRVESKLLAQLPAPHSIPEFTGTSISDYPGYAEFLAKINRAEAMRAAICVMPKHFPHDLLIESLVASAAAGFGSIGLVPDYRDLELLENRLKALGLKDAYVVLHAGLTPTKRYQNFLRILRDEVRIVVGTRNAVFAPVQNLKTIVVLDDSDDVYQDQQAPYWNAREVAALRSQAEHLHLLMLSHARSVEVQQWIQSGWMKDLVANRTEFRKSGPIVRGTSEQDLARDPLARNARIPGAAFTALKQGLQTGPVLISVPRRGYQLNLQCQSCRTRALCRECSGPLQRTGAAEIPSCMRCGLSAGGWNCPKCSASALRSVVIGNARTAEEIGRAFPGIRIITSGKDQVLAEITAEPAIVIATPGAEPIVAQGKYQAAVILDPELSLARVDLRAEEESFFRWMRVLSLVEASAPAVITLPDTYPLVQLLIRLDPVAFAIKELNNRAEARITPVFSTFEVIAPSTAFEPVDAPRAARVLGPLPISPVLERFLVTCNRADAAEVSNWLKSKVIKHSSSKRAGIIQIRRDPIPLR